MQLLRGLYQVGGDLNGITWNGVDAGFEDGNSYAISTPGGIVMIDCGNGDTLPQIFDNMRYWGLEPDAIRACFLTHPHWDHAGAACLLQARGATLYAHRNTADAVRAGDERCCGFLYHKTFTPCPVDVPLDDGQQVSVCGITIEAMHLPGHSQGCTAYFFTHEGKRVAACGDVIGTLLCGDFGWSGSIDFDKKIYTESLRRFARVDTDIMLAGHGLCYFHQPRRRVEQALNSALIQWR
ncbi:MAG TPA: MBL fold metallo-hydrolase [Candidatus Hydrogenedentes bacterium]|nr:MBL fold metallo-hydrolase [Candidatus Hydrogenedentota bacterium]HPC17141.1 MBL fold metallo-hydrolase [Candidatus Hydrogenedentota bacterium]HRT21042.1 MBL fold metallo-hydrolase [Candidatus Hydrogenedentota bacterium]HRT65871.1 MBL fold metallo-hydrolase [Candidatus Hydrogenedentota bacterium]